MKYIICTYMLFCSQLLIAQHNFKFIIDQPPFLHIDAGRDTVMNSNESLNLMANITGGSEDYFFEWYPSEFLSDPNIVNPIISGLNESIYFYLIVDDGKCIKTDSVFVEVVTVSTNINFEVDEFQIYPNPALDVFNIKSYQKIKNVQIIDRVGKNIKSFDPNPMENNFPIYDLNSGMYFILLELEDGTKKYLRLCKM